MRHTPGKLKASARVPIWTSRLLFCEWLAPDSGSITATLTKNNANSYELSVDNQLNKAITGAVLVAEGKVTGLELQVPPGSERVLSIHTASSPHTGRELGSISLNRRFKNAVNVRNRAFGDTEGGRIEPELMNLVASSFPALLESKNSVASFNSSGGIDLSAHAERGGTVLFLLAEDHAPIPSTGLFETKLGRVRTLYRIPINTTDAD